jgi:hypothetical protein
VASRRSFRLLGILSILATFPVLGAGCGGEEAEELAESEGFLLSGRVLKASEVASHLRNAGFQENMIGKMTCVAKWESSFFERAQNGRHRGLFQISSLHLGKMKGCPSDAEALFKAETNVKCALGVFNAQGIKAWSAYTAHKKECDSFRAPAGTSTGGSVDAGRDSGRDAGGESGTSSDEFEDGTEDNVDESLPEFTDDDFEGGGCWSGTLQSMVGPRACVQSSSSKVWFQCSEGQWFRGGNGSSGPFGRCTESIGL